MPDKTADIKRENTQKTPCKQGENLVLHDVFLITKTSHT